MTHDGDVSLDLALSVGQISLRWHGVSSLHRVDDGDVGEQHDQHRDEEAEDEDGDDVGLVDGGVVGFDPVDLTGAISTIWQEHRQRRCFTINPLTSSKPASNEL